MTAPLNGTGLLDDPWGTIFSVWTDFFESILGQGGGNVFYLIPILVLSFGLSVKTQGETMLPIVFLIGSSALLSLGNVFMHAWGAAVISLVLCGIGMTALIMKTVFSQGG